MNKIGVKNISDRSILTVKVVYKNGGTGLKDAYRLLARKLLEEKKKCMRQSMSE